jgi:hypothetical protein
MIKLLTGVASISSGDSPIAPDVSRDGSFNFFSRWPPRDLSPGGLCFVVDQAFLFSPFAQQFVG